MSTIKIPNDIWKIIIDLVNNEFSKKDRWIQHDDKYYNLDQVVYYMFDDGDLKIGFNVGAKEKRFKIKRENVSKVCKSLGIKNKLT